MEQVKALIVGGGRAGLAVRHEVTGSGVEHAVLERGRSGQSWRDLATWLGLDDAGYV
ncbi:MAG: hypothetical protein AABZ33_14570 [Chloroflexota bacterium]